MTGGCSALRLCFLPAVRAANGTNDASFVTGRWSDHGDLSVCPLPISEDGPGLDQSEAGVTGL